MFIGLNKFFEEDNVNFGVFPRNNVDRIRLVLQMLKETLDLSLELLGSG